MPNAWYHLRPTRCRVQYYAAPLLALLLSCTPTENNPRLSFDISNVGAFIAPEVFARSTVDNDSSGSFIQIGDMRFRVDMAARVAYEGQMWANGALTYELAPEVKSDPFKRSQFETACRRLTEASGIACVDITAGIVHGRENHVFVINSDQDYSYVGRVGGRQLLGILQWDNQFVIAHEIKHALGWHHEHQRSDRDAFVRFHPENVAPSDRAQFDIVAPPNPDPGRPYDFDSIMHYHKFGLSIRPGVLKSLETLPQYSQFEDSMGQRNHFSASDVQEIADIYGPRGTKWCGLIPKPAFTPSGCFFVCQHRNAVYGEWLMCGSCAGAVICP